MKTTNTTGHGSLQRKSSNTARVAAMNRAGNNTGAEVVKRVSSDQAGMQGFQKGPRKSVSPRKR